METTNTQLVKGFKGFDKNLKCRGYQFEIGKTFIHNGKVKACSSGFHFCENPIDVLHYYNAGNSRFCEVEGSGDVSKDSSDSKVAVSELHISAEITLGTLVKMGIKFILDKVKYKDIAKATSLRSNFCPVGSVTNFVGSNFVDGDGEVVSKDGEVVDSFFFTTSYFSLGLKAGFLSSKTSYSAFGLNFGFSAIIRKCLF